MVFVTILVRTDSSKPFASCAAGVICLFVHYLYATIVRTNPKIFYGRVNLGSTFNFSFSSTSRKKYSFWDRPSNVIHITEALFGRK